MEVPNQLHHVVLRSHSSKSLIAFLIKTVGMTIQQEFRLPSSILEATLGWPACDGADVTILGSGTAGLIEVLDVPEGLRAVGPDGLAALSFLTDDFTESYTEAGAFATDVTLYDAEAPGVDLLFCTVAGVRMEIMGSYVEDVSAKLG